MAILDKIDLDFQVLNTGNPKILSIMDNSVWGVLEDKPTIIEIITPGSEKIRTNNFVQGKINVFNSSNLLLSPIGEKNDLSDGIYKVTVKGSPDTFCKHRDFLKTDKMRLNLYKLYTSLGSNDSEVIKENKKKILEIDLLIRAAENLVSRGELKKAYTFFKRANKDLKNYNECETCK